MRAALLATAAALCLLTPALANTDNHYHFRPAEVTYTRHAHRGYTPRRQRNYRIHGHGYGARRAPTPARTPAPSHFLPLSAICAFGYWCEQGMFDKPDKPPVSPKAKLAHGIDRSAFRKEIEEHPYLVLKMAWMVAGEVGKDAPRPVKIVQLETAFNRAQARGQTLEHVLLSVSESPDEGYYAGSRAPAGGTYGSYCKPTPEQVTDFEANVLDPVLRGSNLSDVGEGPMTGNASAGVAANEFRRGLPGYSLQGGDSYFREGPFTNPFLELSHTAFLWLGL